jgi:hypothetical protein
MEVPGSVASAQTGAGIFDSGKMHKATRKCAQVRQELEPPAKGIAPCV